MALGPTVVNDPGDSEDEVVCFDDLDPDPTGGDPFTLAQAVGALRAALAGEVGKAPPQPALGAAAAALRSGMAGDTRPHRYLRRAAAWGSAVPDDDEELVIGAAAVLLAPVEPSGLAPADEARLASIGAADWMGAVVGLVRGGPGTSARPGRLVELIGECPEVDGEVSVEEADRVQSAFELILPSWEAAGAIDGEWVLTPLGVWVLPRALAWAWGGDLDGPSPFDAPRP